MSLFEHIWSYLKALFRKEPLVPGEQLRGAGVAG